MMHGDKFNRKNVQRLERQIASARAGRPMFSDEPGPPPAPTSPASRPDLAHYLGQGAMSARKAESPSNVAGGMGFGNTNTTPNGAPVTNRTAQGYPKPNRHGAAPVPAQSLPTWDDVMAASGMGMPKPAHRRTR